MSFRALDHSSVLRDPVGFAKAAKQMGFAAVMRYLPIPAGTLARDAVGRLNRGEIAALHAEGLGVGVVWETTQYRPLQGADAGMVDGPAARQALTTLGFPPGQVVFGAVDFDPTPNQWPAIVAYLASANFEPYANGPTCAHLQNAGFTHFWMHNWGGSNFGDPHIHQQGGQTVVAGIPCDLNDGYHYDCIWWPESRVASIGVKPMFDPPLGPICAVAAWPDGGMLALAPSGAVYALLGAPYHGGANGQPYFAGRTAARFDTDPQDIAVKTPQGGYTVIATSGERYAYNP